jgi:hypothetical protein
MMTSRRLVTAAYRLIFGHLVAAENDLAFG